APAWAPTRISIAVAKRPLNEHLKLLDAQSPFKRPDQKTVGGYQCFFTMSLDEERPLEWGSSGTFWEALLDLCARAGMRIDNIGETIWLSPGRQKWQALTASGPALFALQDVKSGDGSMSFRLAVAIEPHLAPEQMSAPLVKCGGRGLKAKGMMGGFKVWGWDYEVPESNTGPLEAAFEFDRVVETAELVLDPVAASSAAGPGGKGKVSIREITNGPIENWEGKKSDGCRIVADESGLESKSRWLRLPDGTKKSPTMWQSMGFGGKRECTAEFDIALPQGARYVVELVTRTEKVKFDGRIEKLDWGLWTKDLAAVQGRIAWPKAPEGETEVRCGIARLDGAQASAVARRFDLGKLMKGGEEAAGERWLALDGPLTLGAKEDDKFPSFRAEILEEGEWVVWVRVGSWIDAFVFKTLPAGLRHDVAIDPWRAASVTGRAAAGALVRLVPADRDGKAWPLPSEALGDLGRIPVAADGAFRVDGLRPGKYVYEFAGTSTPVELKVGANEVK
ncbi:MAG: carboxypeptidase regulatory-like domain-containing protein, partial [Planctomycetes bacterium]|nr:carboxypeptidase regulatory-like domain-containing protein [Planctomycetota bacterium]